MKLLWVLAVLGLLMVQVISPAPVNATDDDDNDDHTNGTGDGTGGSAGGASLGPDLAEGAHEQDNESDNSDDEPPPSSSFVAEIRTHLEGLQLQPITAVTAKAGVIN